MTSIFAQRLENVRAEINDAAAVSGQNPEAIRLVAVTKFHPASIVIEAAHSGLIEFGESRYQEVPEKQAEVRLSLGDQADELIWHFIGQLQSNKARKVIESFQMIQSVDRASMLERLDRIAGELGVKRDILLQVNISGAETQGGVAPEDTARLAEMAAECKHLTLNGLMAIGPVTDDESNLRKAFASVRKLAERLETLHLPGVRMDTLSMGMSSDYRLAIEEGATLVRLGTVLFGSRS